MRILLVLLLVACALGAHLRGNESSSSGPAAPAPPASEAASSGPASDGGASATGSTGSDLANTLLKLADHMEGKEIDSEHKKFAEAVVKSANVLGTHHATKVTLQQVVDALKTMKSPPKKVLPIKAIVEALRIPPLKPKKKKPDLKKLLATAINAVEGKLDQLESTLASQSEKATTGEGDETTAGIEKSMEELSSSDMITGLEQLTPESNLPQAQIVIPTRRGAPLPAL